MKMKRATAAAALIGAATLTGHVAAQTTVEYGSGEQASVLFAPYDLTNDNETVLRIVNAGNRNINIHVVRVCHGRKFIDDTCRKVDFSIKLTANETHILNVGEDTASPGPNCDYGYIVAYAERTFFDKIPAHYNHLYGDVTITTFSGGQRSGQAPMAGVKCRGAGESPNPATVGEFACDQTASAGNPLGEYAPGGTLDPGVLVFSGNANFELLHNKLKTTFRAGINETRQSIIYLINPFVRAGAQNKPTFMVFNRYSQDEVPASGTHEFICAARLETSDPNVVPILQQDSVGTPNGSIKLSTTAASAFIDALGDNRPAGTRIPAFGWVLREAGKGKRSMKPMWLNEKTAAGETLGVFGDL